MKNVVLKSLFVGGLALLASASSLAIPNFDLLSASGTIVAADPAHSSFYEVTGGGVETGSMATFYSATFGGGISTGYWVTISFDGNPQPLLTSAFLKTGVSLYLSWDSTDLASFNAGTYDSITLWNQDPNGMKKGPGNSEYRIISFAGLNGSPGSVPDGGATVALIGLGLLGLAGLRRRLIRV